MGYNDHGLVLLRGIQLSWVNSQHIWCKQTPCVHRVICLSIFDPVKKQEHVDLYGFNMAHQV